MVFDDCFGTEFGDLEVREVFRGRKDKVQLVGFVTFCAVDAGEDFVGAEEGACEVVVGFSLPGIRAVFLFYLVSWGLLVSRG